MEQDQWDWMGQNGMGGGNGAGHMVTRWNEIVQDSIERATVDEMEQNWMGWKGLYEGRDGVELAGSSTLEGGGIGVSFQCYPCRCQE